MFSSAIYKNNGTKIADVKKLEYNGEFLGKRYVSIDIQSAYPIKFEIGDYIEYRGERFEITYDPSVIKQSKNYSSGDSYKYDSVVFEALSSELSMCDFFDTVPYDNKMLYTPLPDVTFFASSVKILAERIKANLDRVYMGGREWTVDCNPDEDGKKDVSVTISNGTVWDALSKVSELFELQFTIKNRVIRIGYEQDTLGEDAMKYGKGNGLINIERTADSDQKIVTRLRAYGSEKNLPHKYYQKLGDYIPNNLNVKNLMLPDFPDKNTDPYIDSANISVLGIKEGKMFFDGSNDTEEIFPTIQNMMASELLAAGYELKDYTSGDYRLDKIISADKIEDDGSFDEGAEIPAFKIILHDLGFDMNEAYTDDLKISMKSGMCVGREFSVVSIKVLEDGTNQLTCNRAEDSSLDLYFPYNTYNIKEGDEFVLLGISMPKPYVDAASIRLKNAAEEWLAKNDYVRYTYSPKIDNINMQRQHDYAIAHGGVSYHDTISEGMLFMFEDIDLGIDYMSVTIDKLIIKEGGNIPEYDITLREEKVVGKLDRVMNQVNKAISNLSAGGYLTDAIDSLCKTKYLSKLYDDKASGSIEFLKKQQFDDGAQFGKEFVNALVGKGGYIDKDGNAWLNNVNIRNSLVVPKLVYNEVHVYTGVQWETFGSGTIKSVTPDTTTNTGIATLDLVDGEIGSIEEGDLCVGIFHNIEADNDTDNSDDHKGNFHFAGFSTCYFRVVEILDTRHTIFRYALRPLSSTWTQKHHPQPHMTFACYANASREQPLRHAARYKTTDYVLSYHNLYDWEISEANIYQIEGNLDGWSMNGKQFSGYGSVLGNVYMYGQIDSFERAPLEMEFKFSGELIAVGESKYIEIHVKKAYNDITDQMTDWDITRDSGDELADAAWHARDKVTEFCSIRRKADVGIELCLDKDVKKSDVSLDILSTRFTFTCKSGDGEKLVKTIEI